MGKTIAIKNYKKQPKTMRFLILIILIVIFMLAIFISPVFSIRQILLHGNEHYSKEEIIEKMGIKVGENIFLFKKDKAYKALLDDSYIEMVQISIHWPNTIEVKINERKPIGYVPYLGTYLYIDKDGRVLETCETYKKNLPIVQGLVFDSFKVGQVIPVNNQISLDVVATMAQMMIKYNILQDVVKVDISDFRDIHIYVKRLDVSIGGMEQFDKKIQWLIQIMDVYDMGKVDLINIDKGRAVFSPLT
ncbi:MAG: FtsQ-type POTRA domain-containing protein [Epulopiscium sp.]|nr:FtsQ-type POTRA domain-containing protein [Candidatus Epulonipiscium sp.]